MKRFFSVGKELVSPKNTSVFLSSQKHSKPVITIPKNEPFLINKKHQKMPLFPPATQLPDPSFFDKLKIEEQKQFHHKKRRRFSYEDNRSVALSLPYTNEQLLKTENHPQELLNLSKQSIIEHATRRVDLFFYTLIAYYKTSVFPTYTKTLLQHGTGRTINKESMTEACHSSFTPSLLDNMIYKNKKNGKKLKSLLSDTHLLANLNSTVELPPFVNDLDDVLEHTCRIQCLEILRRSSIGEINPIEGISIFLKMMNDVLNHLKETAEQELSSGLSQQFFLKKKHLNPALIDLVITGTLSTTYSAETQTATDEYIQLLLRLKPEEKRLCDENSYVKERIYLSKTTEIQNEILSSKDIPPKTTPKSPLF